MSSFSCPHLDIKNNFCIRLNVECVPGRAGCVLSKKFAFAIPAEERIKSAIKNKNLTPANRKKKQK